MLNSVVVIEFFRVVSVTILTLVIVMSAIFVARIDRSQTSSISRVALCGHRIQDRDFYFAAKIERAPVERICTTCSLDSELFIDSICYIGIRFSTQDIVKKPFYLLVFRRYLNF